MKKPTSSRSPEKRLREEARAQKKEAKLEKREQRRLEKKLKKQNGEKEFNEFSDFNL